MSLQSNKYVVYKKEDAHMLTTDDPEEADKSKIRWDPNDIKREIMYTYCHVKKKIHNSLFFLGRHLRKFAQHLENFRHHYLQFV